MLEIKTKDLNLCRSINHTKMNGMHSLFNVKSKLKSNPGLSQDFIDIYASKSYIFPLITLLLE